MSDCEKPCKARESLPDILESIRRAKKHANYLDGQLMRIEKAYGTDRASDKDADPKRDPTPEPAFIVLLEDEASELADYLLTLQEEFQRKLDLLFGDRV